MKPGDIIIRRAGSHRGLVMSRLPKTDEFRPEDLLVVLSNNAGLIGVLKADGRLWEATISYYNRYYEVLE